MIKKFIGIRWGSIMTHDRMHAEVEKNSRSTDSSQKEWRRPVLRKLPIAATANKISGNEGQGQGKGDNIGFIS